MPNSLYSQGIPKSRFYELAKRVFREKTEFGQHKTVQQFFEYSFLLVINLRSIEDRNKVDTGWKVVNTQSAVLVEIRNTEISAMVSFLFSNEKKVLFL